MAKRTTTKKTHDDDEDDPDAKATDETDETEATETPEPAATEPAGPQARVQIAVDYGDGTYHIIDAPNQVNRALVVSIDGKPYHHVAEHQGFWAYRQLDPRVTK